MTARYAVYFSPDDHSSLARYGEIALGRVADGSCSTLSNYDYHDRSLATELSKTPAHYGFHATLKAPFHLAQGTTESQLLNAVKSLAAQQNSIVMTSLAPRVLSGFMALCFENQPVAIEELAAKCVTDLEPMRAPLSQEAIARRKPSDLNSIQRNYLNIYGYPFVLNEFRFHMTLTGTLVPSEQADYIEWLCQLYASIVTDVPKLDRLAVFRQPDSDTKFTRLAQYPFF